MKEKTTPNHNHNNKTFLIFILYVFGDSIVKQKDVS